jgi:hypothetical protein
MVLVVNLISVSQVAKPGRSCTRIIVWTVGADMHPSNIQAPVETRWYRPVARGFICRQCIGPWESCPFASGSGLLHSHSWGILAADLQAAHSEVEG